MRLSVLDLSPIPPGGSATDAYANTIALARATEAAGYERYWVAEHHGIGHAIAGVCPEVLVGRIAAATSTIRVGAGVALLNYSTPLRLAETYRALAALFGDRIDLGLGRAQSAPVVEAALAPAAPADPWVTDSTDAGVRLDAMAAMLAHEDSVGEVLAWLGGGFRRDDARSQVQIVAGDAAPQPWLVGTSLTSAMLAGRLGLPYAFAAFFNPAEAVAAMRAYRMCFTPSPVGAGAAEPYAVLAVNACCAETDAEADRLRASVELFYSTGGIERRCLTRADDAVTELGGRPRPSSLKGVWPRHLSGSPGRLAELLGQMAGACGADELMVQDLIADQDERINSYELLADALVRVTA